MLAVSMTCSMGAATTAMAADDSATEESADESTEAADTTEASDEDQKADSYLLFVYPSCSIFQGQPLFSINISSKPSCSQHPYSFGSA